jgi:hypothetical protein
MSAAQYRLVSAAGDELESGNGNASAGDGALILTPSAGTALRVPFAHISSVSEPQPFTVLVTMADGNAIELSRPGTMRTQLLVLANEGVERISFSFVDAVQAQDYTVTVSVTGRSPVVLTRLGRRAGELVSLLSASLLARALVARVPRDADWAHRVAAMLAGEGSR